MKFSVLLSIYNKENPLYLIESLNSIFNQTVCPSEVILVKDGPLTDRLDDIIEKYRQEKPILKIVSLPENRGLGYALNEGLKYCSYEWVARMDTDDICLPSRFEKQLEVIQLYPEISFIGTLTAEFNDSINKIVSYRKLPEKHQDILIYAKRRCPLNHPTVMYKREVVLNLGGYNEFPEDYHLWVRALMRGYKFYNIQLPLLYFRTNMDTIRRRGGFAYAKVEISHQKEFQKIGFISKRELIYNCTIRILVRIIPVRLRYLIYFNLLRSKRI